MSLGTSVFQKRKRSCASPAAGSPESLARLAGLPVATIIEIESGVGLVMLGELKALARRIIGVGSQIPLIYMAPLRGQDGSRCPALNIRPH